MRHLSPALSVAFLLGTGALTTAPCPAAASHPFATDDPGTVTRGGSEVELHAVGGRGADCGWNGHVGAGLALHVGLSERVDAGVGITYLGLAGSQWSVEDPVLDLKWRALDQEGARPALALRLDYRAPQASTGVTTGHGLGAVLAASWEGTRWTSAVNLGAVLDGLASADGHAPLAFASVLATRTLAEGLHLGGEALWAQEGLDPAGLDLLAAMLLDVLDHGTLSLGVGPDWRPEHAWGWRVTVGWTHTFNGV